MGREGVLSWVVHTTLSTWGATILKTHFVGGGVIWTF